MAHWHPAGLERLIEEDEEELYDDHVRESLVRQSSELDGPLSALTLDVTVFSHTNGRERREERGIARAELQAAVKLVTVTIFQFDKLTLQYTNIIVF